MAKLLAGFGRSDITPHLGFALVGYGNRPGGATGVHDRLSAKALVMETDDGCWALVSVEMCYLNINTVRDLRQIIEQRLGIPSAHVMVATTHTHAGPRDRESGNWDRPLIEIIADAVVNAYEARQPARMGTGYSFLYGYSINRRWLDRPVDPGIALLRVDDANGNLLGVWSNFACHSVVLGADNYQVSGDWPGYAMHKVEETLGGTVTALFTQGGAGDVNPLVAGVRERLRSGLPVQAIGNVSIYYGAADDPQRWNIGDRKGGTFAEVAEVGDAYAAELLHTIKTIKTSAAISPCWAEQVIVNAAADPGEHPNRVKPPLMTDLADILDEHNIPAEVQILKLGDLILVGEPGEVFGETAWKLKEHLRALGYKTPALVSYANGWLAYLPEPGAFPEGGYEPHWAVSLNISKQFQPRVRAAIEPVLQKQTR